MPASKLPPLPPSGGEITGRTVVDVLSEQHRSLLNLAERAASDREIDVLIAELSRHLSAEEQYLYPSVRAAVPDGSALADRELDGDRALLLAMARADVEVIAAALKQHVAGDCLALLRQAVSDEDLVRLGNRVEMAAEAAPTRPHPGTPSRPPWNKIVDPAVGVIDKVHDVVKRRTTYIRDL